MNTQIAVNANLVSGGSIKEVRAEPFAGQTTVHGWRTGASTTGMLVWDNDWTQLANGGLFTDLAADTIQGNNRV